MLERLMNLTYKSIDIMAIALYMYSLKLMSLKLGIIVVCLQKESIVQCTHQCSILML